MSSVLSIGQNSPPRFLLHISADYYCLIQSVGKFIMPILLLSGLIDSDDVVTLLGFVFLHEMVAVLLQSRLCMDS